MARRVVPDSASTVTALRVIGHWVNGPLTCAFTGQCPIVTDNLLIHGLRARIYTRYKLYGHFSVTVGHCCHWAGCDSV